MLTFSEYEYERPELDAIQQKVGELFEQFDQANTADEQIHILHEYYQHQKYLRTMESLATIRASIDTRDEFYDAERTFFNENNPQIAEITNRYRRSLTNSPFRDVLKEKFGQQLFELAKNAQEIFDPELKDLYVKESRLSTEYAKLIASAEIEFDGRTLNLSEFGKYNQDSSRDVRKKATEAVQSFFQEHLETLDSLYDELVKTRHKIARGLGFNNYVEVGYLQMNRIDYDEDMVENFREQVAEHVVPLVNELKERQRKRIGLSSLYTYDEPFTFIDGPPTPPGSTDEIMNKGAKMYKELSPDTDEFYTFMSERKLFDVDAKKGKESGGYCSFIPQYDSPFIFSNFNGTLGDIKVLTHEAGHAFQSYMSSHFEVPEYRMPTFESAEIHSMSMEYLTYPWMDLFFGKDTDKFKFTHMVNSVSFLPYGVAVDEFQHIVYEHPELTPKERRGEWQKIEQKYLPHRDYDGIEPLESGAFWHRQMHIFRRPFYYIDYTLAQVCAIQFWQKAQQNFNDAWNDYVELCKLGGSLPFGALIETAGLKSPFAEGTLESIINDIHEYLNTIDDTVL